MNVFHFYESVNFTANGYWMVPDLCTLLLSVVCYKYSMHSGIGEEVWLMVMNNVNTGHNETKKGSNQKMT